MYYHASCHVFLMEGLRCTVLLIRETIRKNCRSSWSTEINATTKLFQTSNTFLRLRIINEIQDPCIQQVLKSFLNQSIFDPTKTKKIKSNFYYPNDLQTVFIPLEFVSNKNQNSNEVKPTTTLNSSIIQQRRHILHFTLYIRTCLEIHRPNYIVFIFERIGYRII